MSAPAFTNVTDSAYPSQLGCSRWIASTGFLPGQVGVSVSPVYEGSWPTVKSCCPNEQISLEKAGRGIKNGTIVTEGCVAWCFTTLDKVGAVNKCYREYEDLRERNSTKPQEKRLFSIINCQDSYTGACKGAVVQPSSTATQSSPTTAPSATQSGMATAPQVSLKSIGALVLMLSALVVAA